MDDIDEVEVIGEALVEFFRDPRDIGGSARNEQRIHHVEEGSRSLGVRGK